MYVNGRRREAGQSPRRALLRTCGAVAVNALALLLAQPSLAQTAAMCPACAPELAGDPLVAFSQQLVDAVALWDQAPPGALLCVISGPTSYQFSIVPSVAAAPGAAICYSREGTQIGSAQPLPLPLPPVQVTPSPAGPAQPTPVPDTVIEQPKPTSTPTPSATPRAEPTPSAPSPRRRPNTPAPSQPSDTGQTAPAPAFADETDARTPTPSRSAPVSPVNQPTTVDSPSSEAPAGDSRPANAPDPVNSGVRTVPGVVLGTAVFDSFGDSEVADTSRLPAGRLFIGSNLMSLQTNDGTLLSVSDLPLRFVLSPDDALLAGSGVEVPFGVFAFNPDVSGFDALPTTVDVNDDGSVSVTVVQRSLAAWPGDMVVHVAQADASVSNTDELPLSDASDQGWGEPDDTAAEADADAQESAGPVLTVDDSEDSPADAASTEALAEMVDDAGTPDG